jgi:hypothetical protein
MVTKMPGKPLRLRELSHKPLSFIHVSENVKIQTGFVCRRAQSFREYSRCRSSLEDEAFSL